MVGGAPSCCHRMIENEKRESWFYATETVQPRANDDASATQASVPSFALDTAVVVIDGMTIFNFFKLHHHRLLCFVYCQ
jgi:hypothetical protein